MHTALALTTGAALLACLAGAAPVAAARGPTPADSALLSCLERNLDSLAPAKSAVVAQHLGIEAVCSEELRLVRRELPARGSRVADVGAAATAVPRLPRPGRIAGAPAPLLALVAGALALVAGAGVARRLGGRSLPRTVGVVVLAAPFGASLALAFEGGGLSVSSWGPVSIALLSLLGGAALFLRRAPVGRAAAVAVAGWGALAAWQGLSALWADDPAAAVGAMNLTVLYAAAFTLALLSALAGVRLRVALAFALASAAAVAVGAAAIRLFPSLSSTDVNGRLEVPITYSNSLGALLAFGVVLALGGATDRRLPRSARLVAAATIPLFSLDILFTSSRGAAVVAATGLLAVVALSPERITAFVGAASAAALALPVLLVAGTNHRLVLEGYPMPPHAGDGRRVALILLGTMLASMLVVPVCDAASRVHVPRRFTQAAVALALVCLVAAGGVRATQLGIAGSVDQVLGTVSRETPSTDASFATRLNAMSTGRLGIWKVSLREFRAAPLTGTGAGDFRFWWRASKPASEVVRNAHSLYLETLGESGLVGLSLLATIVGGIAAATRKGGRGHDRVVAAAACAVVGAHLAFDWDWQLPAVVLPAVALAGALVGASVLRGASVPATPVASVCAVLGVLVAISLVVGPSGAALRLEGARRAMADRRPSRALQFARQAERLDPLDPAAFALDGTVQAGLGRIRAADRAFAAAVRRSRKDPELQLAWAGALMQFHELPAARRLLAHGFETGVFGS